MKHQQRDTMAHKRVKVKVTGAEREHAPAQEAPRESDYIAPGLYRWMLDQPPISENTMSSIDELQEYERREKEERHHHCKGGVTMAKDNLNQPRAGTQEADMNLVSTNRVNMQSNFFVALREIARMLVNGTEWNKKARIVLEYDPKKPRMTIETFMEQGESIPLEDREDFLD